MSYPNADFQAPPPPLPEVKACAPSNQTKNDSDSLVRYWSNCLRPRYP